MSTKYQKHLLRALTGLIVLIAIYVFGQLKNAPEVQISPADHIVATTTEGTSTPVISDEAVANLPTDVTGPYQISKIVDGDTIAIVQEGKSVTLRLIGINTPETVDPRRPVECFGKEASAETQRLLIGNQVYLETDATQDTYDKYQRLLAYVFLPDGTNVNKKLVAEGFAYEYTYDKAYRYQKEFKAAETNARTHNLGLWSSTTCSGKK